ncbi:Diaminohydroxyphosphoribosylamino-pyrimidine deaminase [Vanrija pseudolonga]|uniref:Diaminohydroxyphosphoribosylamino-pyrimidine deaminase n=1 Tax=Vanrija pseudolonga TaxID=143232 RepID=A0AAF0YFE5_9TREE|nr:Diaminohydroxyphosphoribosylamino-pyrimidine deaminase [Vanrija pseudolonga]
MSASDPQAPGGVIRLPPGSHVVEDADEEIMELYMALSSVALPGGNSGGLGYLDPTAGELDLTIELVPPSSGEEVKTKGRGKKRAAAKAVSVDLVVVQDPAALRGRVGDTGSVLWRSSLHLAKHVLQQHHFPPAAPDAPLLDRAALTSARVLELGAGTGVLASLLAPLCAAYTATDRRENLKLVRRNVEANGKDGAAEVAELDWLDVAAARKKKGDEEYASPLAGDTDLVIAVDCIYNESLVGPLVDTLAALCADGAVAWVVVELRSSDVLTHFLDTWLNDRAGWTIVRLADGAMGSWDGAGPRWVGWVGWVTGAGGA